MIDYSGTDIKAVIAFYKKNCLYCPGPCGMCPMRKGAKLRYVDFDRAASWVEENPEFVVCDKKVRGWDNDK